METLLRELRQTARGLARDPSFTVFAVLSMALGIGTVVAMFTLVNTFFLSSPPVADPGSLTAVFTLDTANPGLLPTSHPNYLDLADRVEAFEGLAAFREIWSETSIDDRPTEILPGRIVSGNYFDVLGVEARDGRTFSPDERDPGGDDAVVVISHAMWQRSFGGDPSVVGRTLRINGTPMTVIGVTPQEFQGLNLLISNQYWVPMSMHERMLTGVAGEWFPLRDALLFNLVGRRAPGVGADRLQEELDATFAQLLEQYPDENVGLSMEAHSFGRTTLRPERRETFADALTLFMAMAVLLLLISCTSVASLLVARAASRQRELTLRSALGSSTGELVRFWLLEIGLLTGLGGALGLAFAFLLRRLLWAFRPPYLPDSLELAMDWKVLAFAVAVSALAGLAFGIAPLLQALRLDLASTLKEVPTGAGSLRRWGVREVLVMVQVAVSLVALVGAGLFTASLLRAQGADLGFELDRLLVAPVNPGSLGYGPERADDTRRRLLGELATLQGVEEAAAGRALVTAGGATRLRVIPDGADLPPDEAPSASMDVVTPGWFDTLGVPLLRGRVFDLTDRADSRPVAIVNRTLAEAFWDLDTAVGGRFRFAPDADPVTIVGVVEDVSYAGPGADPELFFYRPADQDRLAPFQLYVRTRGTPEDFLQTVVQAVERVEPNLTVPGVRTMDEVLGNVLWSQRLAAALLGGFSLLALLLAAVGLYGVLSHAVRRRRREIGIRMAIGARRSTVLSLIVRQGMTLVAIGGVAGLLLALGTTSLVSDLLFETATLDPLVFAVALGTLVLVSLVAVTLSARQGTRVAPVVAMRQE